MRLSIVIPAYNEAHRIRNTIEVVTAFCERELSQWEVIVVDDGSQDAIAPRLADMNGVECIRNKENMGKGYSVRRGMLAAQLDPVLFMDADLSTPMDEALSLNKALELGADIAIASRRPDPLKQVQRTPRRQLMAHSFRLLVKLIALRGLYDTQCGFKMFRRSSAQSVFSLQRLERWGFDVEVLYIARKKGLRIVEVSVAWEESSESKLELTTPLSMAIDLLRVRWNDLLGRYAKSDESEPT